VLTENLSCIFEEAQWYARNKNTRPAAGRYIHQYDVSTL
jgi:hypothetical protein